MYISIFINQGQTDLVFQNIAPNGRMYTASASFDHSQSAGKDSDILRNFADELDIARAAVSDLPTVINRQVFDGS